MSVNWNFIGNCFIVRFSLWKIEYIFMEFQTIRLLNVIPYFMSGREKKGKKCPTFQFGIPLVSGVHCRSAKTVKKTMWFVGNSLWFLLHSFQLFLFNPWLSANTHTHTKKNDDNNCHMHTHPNMEQNGNYARSLARCNASATYTAQTIDKRWKIIRDNSV